MVKAQKMANFLYPQIRADELRKMVLLTLLGGFIGGTYGVLHDWITFSISPEYFSKLKFKQFFYLNFGFSQRVFAGSIGFVAGGAVGCACSWFFARRWVPKQGTENVLRAIVQSILLVLTVAAVLGGSVLIWSRSWYGMEPAGVWHGMLARLSIDDEIGFVRVAMIHYASYLGCLVGFILALWKIKPRNAPAQ